MTTPDPSGPETSADPATAPAPGAPAAAPRLETLSAWVIERRRETRFSASWSVRWIVGEHIVTVKTRTLDASQHGLRLQVPLKDLGKLRAVLAPGQRHRIEILASKDRLTRMAELRHIGDSSVGFQIDDPLPVDRLLAERAAR